MSEQTTIPTRLDQSPEQSDATRLGHGDVLEFKKKTLDHLESAEVGHARAMVAEVTDAAISAYAAEGIGEFEQLLQARATTRKITSLRHNRLDSHWNLEEE